MLNFWMLSSVNPSINKWKKYVDAFACCVCRERTRSPSSISFALHHLRHNHNAVRCYECVEWSMISFHVRRTFAALTNATPDKWLAILHQIHDACAHDALRPFKWRNIFCCCTQPSCPRSLVAGAVSLAFVRFFTLSRWPAGRNFSLRTKWMLIAIIFSFTIFGLNWFSRCVRSISTSFTRGVCNFFSFFFTWIFFFSLIARWMHVMTHLVIGRKHYHLFLHHRVKRNSRSNHFRFDEFDGGRCVRTRRWHFD